MTVRALLDDPMFWAALYVATAIAIAGILIHCATRPTTLEDEVYARIDEELDAVRDGRVTELLQVRRRRAVDALHGVGADADNVAWLWVHDDAPYAPYGDPEFMPAPRRLA